MMFTKVEHEPIKEGLVAEMGAELFGTLTVLAMFIDENGKCYPTQDHLARLTGVSRSTLNRRLNNICKFMYNGKPILTKQQTRNGGTFSNTVYVLNTDVFSIF